MLAESHEYLLKVLKIPGIKGHLDCLEISTFFKDRVELLDKSLKDLNKALVAVEENEELEQLFVIILKIGNHLN